ncbi:MAG: ROK family protein, partial [Thiobacillus sp.]
MNSSLRLGIDLGGTKIELIALDGSGDTLQRRRVATPQNDYGATVAAIARLVADVEAELGEIGTVGIGMPGTVSPATGLMKNCNSTCLNGKPLQQDIERALGREVRLANDANCFALSEATDGAAAGADVVFGVILGTGVGGGVVVRGQVLTGVNGIAGEWGHSPLPFFQGAHSQADRESTGVHPVTGAALIHPWPTAREWNGAACYCGKKGCVETWLSAAGLVSDHLHYSEDLLTSEEIVQQATDKDGACSKTL